MAEDKLRTSLSSSSLVVDLTEPSIHKQKLSHLLKQSGNQDQFFQRRLNQGVQSKVYCNTPSQEGRLMPHKNKEITNRAHPQSSLQVGRNSLQKASSQYLSYDQAQSIIMSNKHHTPQLDKVQEHLLKQKNLFQSTLQPKQNQKADQKDQLLHIEENPYSAMTKLRGSQSLGQLGHETNISPEKYSKSVVFGGISQLSGAMGQKVSSRYQEIQVLKSRVQKLEKENSELQEYFNEVNEFKHAMESFKDNQGTTPASIDQRRLLLLKSQVLSYQRQNHIFRETIHSQEQMIAECAIVTRWLEGIVEEAQRNILFSGGGGVKNKQKGDNEDIADDSKTKTKRNAYGTQSDDDEITQEKLKAVFKDFNVKQDSYVLDSVRRRIEGLRKKLDEAQGNTRRAHASRVLVHNNYAQEEKKSVIVWTNKQISQKGSKRNSTNSQMGGGGRRDKYDKISIKLDQENILLVS